MTARQHRRSKWNCHPARILAFIAAKVERYLEFSHQPAYCGAFEIAVGIGRFAVRLCRAEAAAYGQKSREGDKTKQAHLFSMPTAVVRIGSHCAQCIVSLGKR